MTEKTSSATGVVREQLAVLSLLIVFVGIVDTDSYYSAMDVAYQSLSLPTVDSRAIQE